MENFMKHDFVIGEILYADLVKSGTWKLEHQNRKSHGLAFFPAGERSFDFDGKKLRADENTVVYFPKGCNYTIREKTPSHCYAINFQMPDGASFAPFAFKVKNAASYADFFRQAQKLQRRKSAGFATSIKAQLYGIISQMQSEFDLPYARSRVIQPALDYIHGHYYKESISVEHLAALCGISTVHLRNLFLKNYGTTPVKYIGNLKLSRAKELLGARFHTVSQVCFLSGFRDESHFCREFKKHFRTTPTEYMKNT